MITLINKNNKLNTQKNSLIVSYERIVNIIFGHYPYPEHLHHFIVEIKNNISDKMSNYTNVKGGMTSWDYFLNNHEFKNFITHVINKHQNTNPDLFQYFLERYIVKDAWGNEIKKGDYLKFHHHNEIHGILYLTKGCDLIVPELNMKITPQPGDYYIFPPQILHGFDTYEGEQNRYSLIFNIYPHEKIFAFDKKMEKLK